MVKRVLVKHINLLYGQSKLIFDIVGGITPSPKSGFLGYIGILKLTLISLTPVFGGQEQINYALLSTFAISHS